ncbi:MAG: HAD family hydrolase [Prolixibacteraceae bacterium]
MKAALKNIRLVATDLDGTLLRNDKSISPEDYKMLIHLGEKGITRIAATGRSLHKVEEVLPSSVPIDYVVYSSGAGIYDWNNQQLLHREFFSEETTLAIIAHLLKGQFNFFVYEAIPNNNLFQFHRGAEPCGEFERYLGFHEGDFHELNGLDYLGSAGQIMAVIPNDTKLFEELKAGIEMACKNVRVIRTTSPINSNYIWLEIFPDSVSKGHGIKWLCNYLSVDYAATVGIGNDYNDLDMFEFVAHPYVLSNGIAELRHRFRTSEKSNEESGFSAVIQELSITQL